MSIFIDYARSFMTDACYDELLVKQNFFDAHCVSLLAAKILGLGIVAGSVLVKVPQIMKILRAGNAEGISLPSFALELLGYLVNLGYNYTNGYPFSTWGEYLFLTIQDIILVILLLYYSKSGALAAPFVILLEGAVVFFFMSEYAENLVYLQYLQAATIPLFAVSKLPQIYNNFKNSSTGQLSAVTLFLNFAGSFGRVFTTLKQVNDFTVLAGFLSGSFLNFLLVVQLLWYWNAKAVHAVKSAAGSISKAAGASTASLAAPKKKSVKAE